MPENPYHPPGENTHAEDHTPTRVVFFGRANLGFAALGFGLLIYSKATRKNGFSWVITGKLQIQAEELRHYLAHNRTWVEIEQFYRAFEGFLILMPAMFLVSGVALLWRTRWSIAISHLAAALATTCCTAFLGIYFAIIKERLAHLCESLGTEVRDHVLLMFLLGLTTTVTYSLLQLRFLNHPVIKRYLERI